MMLLKTVVDETFEDAKAYTNSCRAKNSEEFSEVTLNLAEVDYDDAFVEALSHKVAEYHLHTTFTYDYESSSDAGNGRDDSGKEEKDEPIRLDACIIKDNQLFGVLCEAFEVKRFLLVDYPETIICHPGNYSGRGYHSYREMQFNLISKAE